MSNELATIERPRRDVVPVQDTIPLFDTALFEHMCRIAKAMAHASILPDTLRVANNYEATFGNCLLVVNRARSWQMDPIAVAQCMSIVHGKECFEGKLIAAVIETKLGLKMKYEWFGEPGCDSYGIKITNPENPEEYIEGTVGEWKTKDKQGAVKANWIGANTQRKQLKYRGDREWCRMWRSALMLGVYSDDEMAELADDVRARRATPVGSNLASRLTAGAQGHGFSEQHVGRELGDGEITESQPAETSVDTGGADEDVSPSSSSSETARPSGQADETLRETTQTEAQTPDKATAMDAESSSKAPSDDGAGAADAPKGQPPQPSSAQSGGPSAPTGVASGAKAGGADQKAGSAAQPDFGAYHRALARATQNKSLSTFSTQFRNANAWTTETQHEDVLKRIYAINQRRLKGEFEGKAQALVDELKAAGVAV